MDLKNASSSTNNDEDSVRSQSSLRSVTSTVNVALVYNLKRLPDDQDEDAEFDLQTTIDAILSTIKKLGYSNVTPIEADKALIDNLLKHKIDVVFNIAECSNKRSRESQVPAICDFFNIEHSFSDATSSAITHDKTLAKRLLMQDGILTPNYRLYNGEATIESGLRFPVIVKPNHEGSSKGIDQTSIVMNQKQMESVAFIRWKQYRQPILCEEYIEGKDCTIGILDDGNDSTIIGPLEFVRTEAEAYPIYSFQFKLTSGLKHLQKVCPVVFEQKDQLKKIHIFAKKVFVSLGCRDLARIDFRVDSKGDIYFLELNTLPDIEPSSTGSSLVLMAKEHGIEYEALIERLISPVMRRWLAIKQATEQTLIYTS